MFVRTTLVALALQSAAAAADCTDYTKVVGGTCGTIVFDDYVKADADAAGATLLSVDAPAACTDYNKIVNGVCAQACLNKTVGICPIAIVVKAGGLATGTCAAAGFTKPNGTQSQKAGPCGTITFDDYVK